MNRKSSTAVTYLVSSVLLYFLSFKGAPPYEILILSSYFVLAPFAFGELSIKSFLYTLLCFVLMSLLLGPVGLWGLAILSLFGFYRYAFQFKVEDRFLFFLNVVGAGLFTLLIFPGIFRLSLPYQAPDNVEASILGGYLELDGAMGMSIVNMLSEYGIPSTGLHGTPYLHYHVLGFLIIALSKKMILKPLYEVYYYFTPLVFMPFLLHLIEYCCLKLTKSKAMMWSLPLLMFGLYGGSTQIWHGSFDMSYPAGLIVLFFFLSLMSDREKKTPYYAYYVLIPFAFFGKVSIGLLLSGVLGWMILLDSEVSWKKRFGYLTLLIPFTLLGFYGTFNIHFVSKANPWIPFAYYRYYGQHYENKFHFFLASFALFITFYTLWILCKFLRKKIFPSLNKNHHIITLCALLLALVTMNIYQNGGSNYFFLQTVNWICLPFLIALITLLYENNKVYKITYTLFAFSLLIPSLIQGKDVLQTLSTHMASREEQTSQYLQSQKKSPEIIKENQAKFRPYFEALRQIEKEDLKKTLVYIPESEKDFWEHSIQPYSRFWTPFYIPVLSSQAAFKAYNRELMPPDKKVAWYGPGQMGYSSYADSYFEDLCKESRFDSVLELRKLSNSSIERTEHLCLEGYLVQAQKTVLNF